MGAIKIKVWLEDNIFMAFLGRPVLIVLTYDIISLLFIHRGPVNYKYFKIRNIEKVTTLLRMFFSVIIPKIKKMFIVAKIFNGPKSMLNFHFYNIIENLDVWPKISISGIRKFYEKKIFPIHLEVKIYAGNDPKMSYK